jgi:hypothetical protein
MGIFGGNKEKGNAVDAFIQQKLNENNLKLNPVADKETLLRRVSLDLIGIPAPKDMADKYLKSTHARAFPGRAARAWCAKQRVARANRVPARL